MVEDILVSQTELGGVDIEREAAAVLGECSKLPPMLIVGSLVEGERERAGAIVDVAVNIEDKGKGDLAVGGV